jgi:hypothetical protein
MSGEVQQRGLAFATRGRGASGSVSGADFYVVNIA